MLTAIENVPLPLVQFARHDDELCPAVDPAQTSSVLSTFSIRAARSPLV
jgi:hypothetical protein